METQQTGARAQPKGQLTAQVKRGAFSEVGKRGEKNLKKKTVDKNCNNVHPWL